MNRHLLILINLLLLTAIGLASQKNALSLTPGQAKVVEAIDGDTLLVELAGRRETVRLIGVDTPETKDRRKPVQCFGQAAADFTKSLAEGKTVRLAADPHSNDRDKYRRLLRYAYLPDSRLLNAVIIESGYGFAYTIFPYEKIDDFRALEANARRWSRGLWSGCQIDDASQVKQTR